MTYLSDRDIVGRVRCRRQERERERATGRKSTYIYFTFTGAESLTLRPFAERVIFGHIGFDVRQIPSLTRPFPATSLSDRHSFLLVHLYSHSLSTLETRSSIARAPTLDLHLSTHERLFILPLVASFAPHRSIATEPRAPRSRSRRTSTEPIRTSSSGVQEGIHRTRKRGVSSDTAKRLRRGGDFPRSALSCLLALACVCA